MNRSSLPQLLVHAVVRTKRGRRVAMLSGVLVMATGGLVVSSMESEPPPRGEVECQSTRDFSWGEPDATIRSYGFVDISEARLERLREDLEERGYEFVGYGGPPCGPICSDDCQGGELRMIRRNDVLADEAALRVREAEICAIQTEHQVEMGWGIARPTDNRRIAPYRQPCWDD